MLYPIWSDDKFLQVPLLFQASPLLLQPLFRTNRAAEYLYKEVIFCGVKAKETQPTGEHLQSGHQQCDGEEDGGRGRDQSSKEVAIRSSSQTYRP